MTESPQLLQVKTSKPSVLKLFLGTVSSLMSLGFVLSCRNPDEARVLSEEVLDRLQTGNEFCNMFQDNRAP